MYYNIACELNAIRNVLQVNRALVQSKMYGYEGSDVFEIIKNVSLSLPMHTACNESLTFLKIIIFSLKASGATSIPDKRKMASFTLYMWPRKRDTRISPFCSYAQELMCLHQTTGTPGINIVKFSTILLCVRGDREEFLAGTFL